jgi:hypothetical protein
MMVSSPEGLDLYLDGIPVDPDTGLSLHQEVIDAADSLVSFMKNGGWKMTTDVKRLTAAVKRYEEARLRLVPTEPVALPAQVHQITHPDTEAPPKISKPEDTPKPSTSSKPRPIELPPGRLPWDKFVANLQKKYKPGQMAVCPQCKGQLPTFTDLREHWEQGHFDHTQEDPVHIALRSSLPQREGPSAD